MHSDLHSTGYNPVKDSTEPADKVNAANEVPTLIAWHQQQPSDRKPDTKLHTDPRQHKTTRALSIQAREWKEEQGQFLAQRTDRSQLAELSRQDQPLGKPEQ